MKKKIFLDFDGVLNTYKGWNGENELFEPRAGSLEFLQSLATAYEVYIFTTRDREKVYKWMIRHNLCNYIKDVTNKKEPAYLYIDDRAIKFDGDYSKTLEDIEKFQPHWKEKETL